MCLIRIPQHLRDGSDDDCELPAVCETADTKTARRRPAALPPDAAETATVQDKQLPPAPSPPNLSVTPLAPDEFVAATSLSGCSSTSNPVTSPAYVNLIDHCGAINEEQMLKHRVLDLLISV